jgi:hypothetical protein
VTVDARIVELHVDDEPRRRARRLTLAAVGLAAGWALLTPSQPEVDLTDVERRIKSDLSGELLGDVRVAGVSCATGHDARPRCLAELYDKSGAGPIMQRVAVSIDQDTGEYAWGAA